MSWLLSGEVQLAAGPEAGGVFGWFDADPASRFVYPETTGYYLTFLSFLRAQKWPAGDFGSRARRAAAWIARWSADAAPPARVYLAGPQTHDWRNRLAFSFDLGMIWRGLAMARQPCSTIERLLARFPVAGAGFLAAMPIQSGPVAQSWSAQPGAFQLKLAAALLHSGVPADPALRQAAEAVFAQYRHWDPPDCRRDLLHPYLYAVEGALLTRDHRLLRQAASWIAKLAPHVDGSRSDVLAQLLRSACLLDAAGYLPHREWSARLPELAEALCGYCAPDGRMYFRRDSLGRLEHVNVWSGMFAAQALMWFSQWRASALGIEAAAWLV